MNIMRFFMALSLGLLFACGSSLHSSKLPLNKQFVMTDNLMCTIRDSSEKNEIGEKIALIGLSTMRPQAKYESGTTYQMKKVFEDEVTITVQGIVKLSGSVDTFVIDKKNGNFSRATAGYYLGVYSSASIGTCE